jgi:prepilin-type processing-associated H-X9-DG protein
MMLYAHDNSGMLPSACAESLDHSVELTWDDLLARYIGDAITLQFQNELNSSFTSRPSRLLQCPSDDRPLSVSIRRNASIEVSAGIRSYAMTTATADGQFGGTGAFGYVGLPENAGPRIFGIRLADAHHPSATLLLVECQTSRVLPNSVLANLAGSNMLASISRPVDQRLDVAKAALNPPVSVPAGQPAHDRKWNYLFCDGHVQALPPAQTVAPSPGENPLLLSNGMWIRH